MYKKCLFVGNLNVIHVTIKRYLFFDLELIPKTLLPKQQNKDKTILISDK